MVSYCANIECSVPFRYFRGGRLLIRPLDGRLSRRRVEHFWLCESCAKRYTLRLSAEGAIVLIPAGGPDQARSYGDTGSDPDRPRQLIEALDFELQFLDKGGYHRSDLWRFAKPSIFEDSPICPNRRSMGTRIPCGRCVLSSLIPEGHLHRSRACHFIPLDSSGTTLFSLLQADADIVKVESLVRSWICRQLEFYSSKGAIPRRRLAPEELDGDLGFNGCEEMSHEA